MFDDRIGNYARNLACREMPDTVETVVSDSDR
jgi:hypothetical protein